MRCNGRAPFDGLPFYSSEFLMFLQRIRDVCAIVRVACMNRGISIDHGMMNNSVEDDLYDARKLKEHPHSPLEIKRSQ